MLLNTLQLSLRCLSRPSVFRAQKLKTSVTKRNATGWLHRRPIAIVNEEIVLDKPEEASKPSPRKHVNVDFEHRPMKAKTRHRRPKLPTPRIESDEVYKEDGTLNIYKYSEDDRKLMSLILALKSRKMREKNSQMLLEGLRLIEDAIKAHVQPEIILFSRSADVAKLSLPKTGVKLYKVPYSTLQLWSSFSTSPGIMGIFKCPKSFEKETSKYTLPLTIICDNVRDPGNLGTIIRAAAGVGCERLILTKGCVDVWEQKVMRSAAGAHFRLSISKSAEWSEIQSLISSTASVYVADNSTATNYDEELVSPAEKSLPPSEGDLDAETFEKSAETAFEADAKDDNSETSQEIASEEHGEKCDSIDAVVENESEKSDNPRLVTVAELSSRIPVIPYYAADYSSNETVLIVGGETEGLSYDSVKLVAERKGVRVNIPLNNEVESLNTGMALGIVAFEVKRQFAIRHPSFVK